MFNKISGGDHYFHLHNDATQTQTAQRATFAPAVSTKIANYFLRKENSKLQKFGGFIKQMRNMNIDARSSVRNFFSKEPNEIKQTRYELKKKINDAAPDQVNTVAEQQTKDFQEMLLSKGYVASGGLGLVAVPRQPTQQFRNADGHVFNANYTKAPFLARKVAQLTSVQHDAGDTGIKRAIKRGALYGAVGAANAIELGKQGVFAAAASKFSPLGAEERNSAARAAAEASDTRGLNMASLKGNEALAESFLEKTGGRHEFVSTQASLTGYEVLPDLKQPGGVSAASTSYMARRMNDYFSSRSQNAGRTADTAQVSVISEKDNGEIAINAGQPEPAMKKRKAVATALVELANLKSRGFATIHGWRATSWAKKAERSNDGEARIKSQQHDAKRFNARFRIETRRAAVNGTMRETVDALLTGQRDAEVKARAAESEQLLEQAEEQETDKQLMAFVGAPGVTMASGSPALPRRDTERSAGEDTLIGVPRDKVFDEEFEFEDDDVDAQSFDMPHLDSDAEFETGSVGSSYAEDMNALGVQLGEPLTSLRATPRIVRETDAATVSSLSEDQDLPGQEQQGGALKPGSNAALTDLYDASVFGGRDV